MRTGVLANSLPSALLVYEEVKAVKDCELFILLCPAENESRQRSLLYHLARLILKQGRLKSLRLILARKVILFHKSLDHPDSLARLHKLNLDVGLHKAGVIYRDATIKAFRLGILNAHIGILPAFRGRSVMEWSLLQDSPVGITVFFIDACIDTGERIVFSEEVDITHCRTVNEAKRYLFGLDAVFYHRALDLLRAVDFQYKLNDRSGHRYYVMSKLFQGVAEEHFKSL